MDIFRYIQDIKVHLKLTFDEVDGWFKKDKETLNGQPSNGGWTVQQILEHIYLTNFYLLIDQLQDKYDEIFGDIKKEKMDWSFEDFLQSAEGAEPKQNTAPIIPLEEKKKPSFPKWFWMAASVMLVFGIGFFLNNNSGTEVQDKGKLVKDEILKQKSGFIEENSDHQEQVAVNHTDSISGVKKD